MTLQVKNSNKNLTVLANPLLPTSVLCVITYTLAIILNTLYHTISNCFSIFFNCTQKFGDGEMILGCDGVRGCTVRGHVEKFLMRERGTLLAAVCSLCVALDQLKHYSLLWSSKTT